MKNKIHFNTTHGDSLEVFYRKWRSIKARCKNKKFPSYKRYGGRGIKICDRWLKYENFKEDMYKSYLEHAKLYGKDNTTIERINNDGNYCKENCKWITWKEQYENKSNIHLITYKGKTQRRTKWAEELGINKGTLKDRFARGWTVEEAFTIPTNIFKRIR